MAASPLVIHLWIIVSTGLSDSDARKLDSFMHFGKSKKNQKKSTPEKGEWSPAINFLDVLTDDIPKGEATWPLHTPLFMFN